MKRLGLILIIPILFIGGIFSCLRYLTCIFTNPDKAWHIALQEDELINVGANGRVDETISARAAKAQKNKKMWGCILCGLLNMIQKDHCQAALKDDVTGP